MSTQTEKHTQTTLAEMRPQQEKIENLPSTSVGLTTLPGFELVQRAAKCLAASSLVPKDYQGNVSNCVVVLNMAARVGADPLMVMQNLVVVHGRPTWSAQFMIATVNSCGRFSALRYEFFGTPNTDAWGCRAWAIEKSTGEKLVGTDVTIAIAKAEGWYGKNGSKWKTIPQQMLMYRAGSWWTRAYAPELSMGLHTVEEVRDFIDADLQPDGTFAVNLETLRKDGAAVEHDPATGEIKTPPVNELKCPLLESVEQRATAGNQLVLVLNSVAADDRPGTFVNAFGPDIIAALSAGGQTAIVDKIKELGIKIDQASEK